MKNNKGGFMNLEELITKGNEKYEDTLLHICEGNGYLHSYLKNVSMIDEVTGEERYGVESVILGIETDRLPKIYVDSIVPIQYRKISKFENFSKMILGIRYLYPFKFNTEDGYVEIKLFVKEEKGFNCIDVITKEDKFKYIRSIGSPDFYFIGITDDNKYSMFEIDIIKDKDNNDISKVKYIAKNCICASSFDRYEKFHLIKEYKNSVLILEYTPGVLTKKKYEGKLVGSNGRFVVLKENNEFLFFEGNSMQLLTKYSNDDIVDMQLCPYEEDIYPHYHDAVILTTKDNKKKILSITINDKNMSFIENEYEFDDLHYNFCHILYEDDMGDSYFDEGFSFYGNADNENYRINLKPKGDMEVIKLYTNTNDNAVLKKTRK